MQYYDALRVVKSKAGMKWKDIADSVGISEDSFGVNRSRKNIPNVERASDYFNACGYALCVMPSDLVPRNAIEITTAERMLLP